MLTVLCGGFGAARFVSGLARASGGDELRCVVNTADDVDYLGLYVSPDVDSVCYALAGVFDEQRGWGVAGDTFRCNAELARYNADWFRVGDADLALHLERNALLTKGSTLSAATATITQAWRLPAVVLPMTDARVRTVVDTDEGRLELQDYLVARSARPRVRQVTYAGADEALPAPGVLAALRDAEVVLFAPSNPVTSIGPILSLPGVRDALAARTGPTVAVTPVVRGRAPATRPEQQRADVRAKLMAARGHAHRARDVAGGYVGLVDGFVLDACDASERAGIAELGMAVHVVDTLERTAAGREAFARDVIAFARSLGPSPARGNAPH